MDTSFDLHVYTNNSIGGNDKVSFLCETAVNKGLRAVAFTDICDISHFDSLDSKRRLRHSYFDMTRARAVFFGQILVLCGIEFRQAIAQPEIVAEILSKQDYDIVLSCVCEYPDGKPFDLEYGMSTEKFNEFSMDYSRLLLKTVEETDFDVLSKPLAPLRNISEDFTFFEECMKPVMKTLAKKNKALEINTKDILGSEKVRDTYIRLLRVFKEAGGCYVTIGSESCFNDEIGNGADIAQTALKMSGFNSVTLFDKRIPYTFEM